MRVCLAVFLFCLTGFAQAHCAEQVKVEAGFIRAPIPGQINTAAFMTFLNDAKQICQITHAASTYAKNTELHNHLMENGVMHMREVEAIEIPALGKTVLQSGGLHVMLLGLKPENQGVSHAEITFQFSDGSTLNQKFPIQKMLTQNQHHH